MVTKVSLRSGPWTLAGRAVAGFDGAMVSTQSNESATPSHATVAESLTVHGDIGRREVDALVDHWAKLDARLRSFDPGSVQLDLYLKDRDRPGQHLTLEATIAHWPVLIATSSDADLGHGLNVVRDEMIRLITDARDRHSPRRRR